MIINIVDFVETVRVMDILGRKAHDVRYNLWYDCNGRIIYSTGHALAVYRGGKRIGACVENDEDNWLVQGQRHGRMQSQMRNRSGYSIAFNSIQNSTNSNANKRKSILSSVPTALSPEWKNQRINNRHFIHMMNGTGLEPSQ